jgi:hypothetical protein
MTDIQQPATAPEQLLVTIGDIAFSAHWLVTPAGSLPLKDTQLNVSDLSRLESKIPVWAIVLAVLFFPLGLLFLLAKEQVIRGSVQVVASNASFVHSTQIPVLGPHTITDVQGRVGYARQLIAAIR